MGGFELVWVLFVWDECFLRWCEWGREAWYFVYFSGDSKRFVLKGKGCG